jgi:hypothetical protein
MLADALRLSGAQLNYWDVAIKDLRSSAHSQRILQLSLGHSGASFDMPRSRFFIQLLPRMAIGSARSGDRSAMTACGLPLGVTTFHDLGALPLAIGTDV